MLQMPAAMNHVESALYQYAIKFCARASGSSTEDIAFKNICAKMQEDRQKTWSSVSSFGLYVDEGGSFMCRKTLFKNVAEYHN